MFVLNRCPLVLMGATLLCLAMLWTSLVARDGNVVFTAAVAAADKPDQEPDLADKDGENASERDDSEPKKEKKSADSHDADNKETDTKEAEKEEKKTTKAEAAEKKDKQSQSTTADTKPAEQDEEKAEADEKSKPSPFVVKEKPLRIEQKLDGIFVAENREEIALRPDAWTRYVIKDVVEHGAKVKKGDVLVRFDDEQIEERLAEETIDQRLSELALMQAEEEAPRSDKLLKFAYEAAKRSYDQLVEDHKYYLETDRPFAERIAKYRYESAKEDLASQEEELEQLKKMYEADEITEETEKIVLRRQEFEVATAKLMLELQEANRDYTLNVLLPRNDVFYTKALNEAKLALEQAKTALELGTTRGKYDLEKKRAARSKSVQAGAKLLNDRDLMEIKAPTDGTVYYGRCVSGQWAEIGSMMTKLVPYSMIPPNTVLMTIVKQRPLYVLTNVSEKELPDFKTGLIASLTPTAKEDDELTAKVTELAKIPGGGKKFEMRLELDQEDLPEWLVAGMNCSVKVTTYDNKNALMVPAAMINTDEDNDKLKYVMLSKGDDREPIRREVKVGKTKDKEVEILSGLKAGDKIIKEDKKKGEEDE